MQVWRNWQTRMVQVHMNASSCRFKSCYLHQNNQAIRVSGGLIAIRLFCRKKIKFLLRFFIVFSLSMRTGELRAYIKRKSMQSLGLHQHSLLIENSNIPYLSPSGSAEILPATRKVMIVLTPLQRRDAYCRVRCAKCTVQAVRDARSITLYRDRLSWQSSGYVLWSCRGSLGAAPLGCPGFMA